MRPGFLVEVGEGTELNNCSDITYFFTESRDRKHVTRVYVYINDMLTFCNGSCNLDRKCIITEERFVLELPTSRAMLATARPSCQDRRPGRQTDKVDKHTYSSQYFAPLPGGEVTMTISSLQQSDLQPCKPSTCRPLANG